MNEFEGLLIEPFEDQVFNITKYRYASSALISDWFYRHGDNWAREAVKTGLIPYYDELGFVRWKQDRTLHPT